MNDENENWLFFKNIVVNIDIFFNEYSRNLVMSMLSS